MEIRIYSLNKLAYLERHNIKVFYEFTDKGACGCVFGDEEVKRLLLEFKHDEELHSYLSAFKKVRDNLKEVTKRHGG